MGLDVIKAEDVVNLSAMFRERVQRSPERVAYRQYDGERSCWRQWTWREMADEVGRWQVALREEGLQAGDRVALMLRNGKDWVACDQAVLGLDLVSVPLYTDDRVENVIHILNETKAKILVIDGDRQWRNLASKLDDQVHLQKIFTLSSVSVYPETDSRLCLYPDWVKGRGGKPIYSLAESGRLASIIYTSGTSGRPKGVMLSHQNILVNAWAVTQVAEIGQEDVFLSFLPLSHALERTAGYYLPMLCGATVAFARSVQQLAEDLQIVQPTLLISVPRVYERIHARIQQQLRRAPIKRWLFYWTIRYGWACYEREHSTTASISPRGIHKWLDQWVGAAMRARMGGRLRFAICGGAPLQPTLMQEFCALGIPMLQGYGLTEAGPVVSVNHPQSNRPGSIGLPLTNVSIKLDKDTEELSVKGPNIMLGFWNNPEYTRERLDQEGWLRTGDQVRQDEKGHLYIVGRLKDIIVLGNGEKLPPTEIEMAITMDPLFNQVLVLGEGRPFLLAILVLNPELWRTFARSYVPDPDYFTAVSDQQIHKQILKRLRRAMRTFPGYAQIRRVILTLEPWTIDNGCLTPTQKVKRDHVEKRFAEQIDRVYQQLQ